MALLLKGEDLRILFEDPSSMDSLLEIITEAFRSHQKGEGINHPDFQLPLEDRKRTLRFLSATVPGCGVGVRSFPLFSGARDASFILLYDGDSGRLQSLVAGAELNVWRTGAPAGVACRYLARAGAKSVGLLGSGRQARGQLLAIRRALPALHRVRVFSPTEEHRNRFAQEMSSWLRIDVEPVESAQAAVEGADIVDVATNSRSPVLDPGWISPGTLIITIASGQVPPELVLRSRVIVAWLKEVLEGRPPREPYAAMIASGEWSADKIAGELGAVITEQVTGRQNDIEVVLFEMPGVPLWDVAAASWAYQWALETKAGETFSLT